MHTQSFWLTLPEQVVEALPQTRAATIAGLRGVGQVLETVSTLALMCDPRDINRTLGNGASDESAPGRDPFSGKIGGFDPTLFLFDAAAGGIGLSIRIFEQCAALLSRTRRLIEGCHCQVGCPACVGPSDELPAARGPALAILAAWELG